MLDDSDLAQIVDAISRTPQFQFLDQMMAEEQAAASESATFGEEEMLGAEDPMAAEGLEGGE